MHPLLPCAACPASQLPMCECPPAPPCCVPLPRSLTGPLSSAASARSWPALTTAAAYQVRAPPQRPAAAQLLHAGCRHAHAHLITCTPAATAPPCRCDHHEQPRRRARPAAAGAAGRQYQGPRVAHRLHRHHRRRVRQLRRRAVQVGEGRLLARRAGERQEPVGGRGSRGGSLCVRAVSPAPSRNGPPAVTHLHARPTPGCSIAGGNARVPPKCKPYATSNYTRDALAPVC